MSEREWRFYLDDMLRFAEKVRRYTVGIDQTTFEHDELKYDAILRNLELIGEAATNVLVLKMADERIPGLGCIAARVRLYRQ